MQTPKRQIIKTRPQRRYIIARVIAVLLIVAALVLTVVLFLTRAHPAHAFAPGYRTALRQEAPFAERKAPNQASLGHVAHEDVH